MKPYKWSNAVIQSPVALRYESVDSRICKLIPYTVNFPSILTDLVNKCGKQICTQRHNEYSYVYDEHIRLHIDGTCSALI